MAEKDIPDSPPENSNQGNENENCTANGTSKNMDNEVSEYEKTSTLKAQNKVSKTSTRYVDLTNTIATCRDDTKENDEKIKETEKDEKTNVEIQSTVIVYHTNTGQSATIGQPTSTTQNATCNIMMIPKTENVKVNRIANMLPERDIELMAASNWMIKLSLLQQKLTMWRFALFCCEVFLKKMNNLACNLILIFMSVVEMLIGLDFLTECPKQRLIPIHLFISGAYGTLLCFLNLIFKTLKEANKFTLKTYDIFSTLLSSMKWIFFLWQIYGCYLVYSIAFPNFVKSADLQYCSSTVYGLTLLVIHLWLFISTCIIIIFGVAIFYYRLKKKQRERASEPEKCYNINQESSQNTN